MRKWATLIGCFTALLWATIPVLVVFATPTPPFLTTGLAFVVGWLGYVLYWARHGKNILRLHHLPLPLLAIGTIGLGGDTVLQVASLQLVPPIEANLIDATYPILTFIFAALILKSRIAYQHIIGLLTAFIGVILIITNGTTDALFDNLHLGHLLAMASALVLSLYAVYQAYRADITADATGAFFFYSALLLLLLHAIVEPSYLPTLPESLAIFGIGVATCGGFLCWFYGMNYGNAPVIAASSYSGHVLSNALLVFVGAQPMPPLLALAALLILGGALFAAKNDIKAGIKSIKS